jgi:hypothetical protein
MVGTQEAVLPGEATRQPNAPPGIVVVLALALGGALVGGTTIGGYLLTHDTRATSPAVRPVDGAAVEPVVPPNAPPLNDWRGHLTGPTCDAACVGGLQCAAKPLDCTSGLSCIPGTGTERFANDESWMLHLSAVQELDGSGQLVDPCESRKDFWVCRSNTAICASQAEACANAGRTLAPIPVYGAELDHVGVALDVRLGGPTGPIVAAAAPIRNLRRGGLCRGFVVKTSGGNIAKISYFLLPPADATP